jgi:hypothetical protein
LIERKFDSGFGVGAAPSAWRARAATETRATCAAKNAAACTTEATAATTTETAATAAECCPEQITQPELPTISIAQKVFQVNSQTFAPKTGATRTATTETSPRWHATACYISTHLVVFGTSFRI